MILPNGAEICAFCLKSREIFKPFFAIDRAVIAARVLVYAAAMLGAR